MNFLVLLCAIVATLFAASAVTVDHDKVQSFEQPEPVTTSEKAAVKCKPQLKILDGCLTYPAVSPAGETNGGLKPDGDTWTPGGDCWIKPASGTQVYGRSAWHNDVWAIMYAWYFPTGFWWEFSSRRHDWASAVVWIDNPTFEKPKILGISSSRSATRYKKYAPPPESTVSGGSTPKFAFTTVVSFGPPLLEPTDMTGETQQLIMWEQLTEVARVALNTTDFGNARVPFNDVNFVESLQAAWPF